jgi:hypothetical protein
MNNKYIKLIFIIVILTENISTNGLDVINESDPLKELFLKIFIEKDYSTLVRPTLNATSRLTRVETELKLLQIDLDEKYQELISTAWIEMIWFDNRLTWNPDEFDGITEITVNVDKIWVNK